MCEGDLGELDSCDRWEEEGEPRYPESGQLGGDSLLSYDAEELCPEGPELAGEAGPLLLLLLEPHSDRRL